MLSREVRKTFVALTVWVVVSLGSSGVFGQAECGTLSTAPVLENPCMMGQCDKAVNRDVWNTGIGSMPIGIRVIIHVFDNEILGLPEAQRNQRINQQRNKIIADFAWTKIALVVLPPVLYENSPYATVGGWTAVANMKSAHAQSPATQLNVYVSNLALVPAHLAAATHPWDENALGVQGGIIIDGSAFGPDKTTLTHEIGHILGLWHTFHGNDRTELQAHAGDCNPYLSDACECTCHEAVGDPFCNDHGDFCCDTAATTGNESSACAGPTGPNTCGLPWGSTNSSNFMDYSLDAIVPPCRAQFTPQQARRQHCWTCAELTGWIAAPSGACCIGNSCIVTPEPCCVNQGGTFAGAGSTCENCTGTSLADACEFPVAACCTGSACSFRT